MLYGNGGSLKNALYKKKGDTLRPGVYLCGQGGTPMCVKGVPPPPTSRAVCFSFKLKGVRNVYHPPPRSVGVVQPKTLCVYHPKYFGHPWNGESPFPGVE